MTNKTDSRPLSPHIPIYKPQISSFTSILHRITGILLYIGIIILSWIIVYHSYKFEIYSLNETSERCDCFWLSLLQKSYFVIIVGWAFALYYHLCNGIRHLFWDIGKGFDKKTANRNGLIAIFTSILLTTASSFYVLIYT